MRGSRPVIFTHMLVALAFILITGCGGGGSSSDGVISLNPAATPSGSAAIQLTSSELQLNSNTTASAVFLDVNGNPVAGLPVNFSTSLGTLSPSTGLATTDASGIASVQLVTGDVVGTGIVSASATVGGSKISKSATFTVSFPQINISAPVLGLSTDLAPGASTSVTVNLTDAAGAPFTTPVDVSFASEFASAGKATIMSPVRSSNGSASSTYTATGGVGTDTITISVGSVKVTKTVNVLGAAASSISFVSATPKNIALKGSGGVGSSESSVVVFKVVDTNGQPKSGQTVDFTLNTSVGGLSLLSTSGSTAADGTVSTVVNSGVVATPVRVTAVLRGSSPLIATQSDLLVISTGVPAQDGFSIAASNRNPEAWNTDGVAVSMTARLSDHFHNPVPDGTAVYFTTSGGSIQPSCTTVNGTCSVNWISQAPRPLQTRGALRNGRAVVLAYAVGEEYFLDLNGNGLADPTDTFEDDPEAFRDDNESGTRQTTETFIDFNIDGLHSPGDNLYNGVLQGTAFVGAPRSKHVFSNSVIVMASSSAIITPSLASISAPGPFSVTVTDVNGNTMPSGTIIVVAAPFGTLSGITSHTVPQNTGFGVTLSLNLAAADSPKVQTGFITITVTSPDGLVTTRLLTVSGAF